jgi:SAM-dependent methyltransferase
MTHSHHHAPDASAPSEFWEDFYAPGRRPWSGHPNRLLVDELARQPLVPGTALDLGCGTGGDALWLAQQGWTVTGVDLAQSALAQAEEAAAAAGLADLTTWQRVDLDAGLPAGSWDLVTSAYLQAPVALSRDGILRAATAAVAPGGTLLVIGHHGPPSWAEPAPEHMLGLPDADDVLAVLALPADWTVERAETVAFDSTSPEGRSGTRTDSLVRVRRPG